jgi:hypothetical protein
VVDYAAAEMGDIEIKDAFATMDEVRLPDGEMDNAFFFFKLNIQTKVKM